MFLNLSQLQFSLIIFDFYDLFLQKIRKCQNENIWLFFSFGRTLKLFSTFAFRPKQSKSLTPGRGWRGVHSHGRFFRPQPLHHCLTSSLGRLSLRGLSRRLETFCEFCLSVAQFCPLRRVARLSTLAKKEKVLVFLTGAADVTISRLPRAFQTPRYIVK